MDSCSNSCETARGGGERERERKERERDGLKEARKEDQIARTGRKAAKHCVFLARVEKVGSLQRRVQSHLAGSDQKLHAAVAQSAFPSQNAKHTAGSEHFWKLSCRKNVRGCAAKTCPRQHAKSTTGSNRFWTLSSRSCGVKHMSKSKNTCLHHFWMLKRCSS